MIRLTRNHLLMATLGVLVAFFGIGPLIPGEQLSAAVGLLMTIWGGIVLGRYGVQTWRILINRMRSEEGDGSHLAAYGITLLALGSVWSGLFRLTWLWMDRPEGWLLTVFSSFGPFCMAWGYALLFFSPDVTRQGFSIPFRLWAVSIGIALIIFALWLGIQIGKQDVASAAELQHMSYVAPCPASRPIAGNIRADGQRVYHAPSSAYYPTVVAERCFKTEREARLARFRPPG